MNLQKGKHQVGHTQAGYPLRFPHTFPSRSAPIQPPNQRSELQYHVQGTYTPQSNTPRISIHHPNIPSPSSQGPAPTCSPHDMNKQSHLPGQPTMPTGSYIQMMYSPSGQTAQSLRPQTNTQSFCLARAPSTPRPISGQRPGPAQHSHDPQVMGLPKAGHQFQYAQSQVPVQSMSNPQLLHQSQSVYAQTIGYFPQFQNQRHGQPNNYFGPTNQNQTMVMAPTNQLFPAFPANQTPVFYTGGGTLLPQRHPTLPAPQHPSHTKPRRQKPPIVITDPETGKDLSEEIFFHRGSSNDPTPPRSGESSARETPPTNPTPPPRDTDGNIAAQFAAQVAAAALEPDMPVGPILDTGSHIIIQKDTSSDNQKQQSINRTMLSDSNNLNIREKTPDITNDEIKDITNESIADTDHRVIKIEDKSYSELEDIVTEPIINDISSPETDEKLEVMDGEVVVLENTMPTPGVTTVTGINDVKICKLKEAIKEKENKEVLDPLVKVEESQEVPVFPAPSESETCLSPIIPELVTPVNQDNIGRQEPSEDYDVEREVVEIEEPLPQPQSQPEPVKEMVHGLRHNGETLPEQVAFISTDAADGKASRQNQKVKKSNRRPEFNRKNAEKEGIDVDTPVNAPEAAAIATCKQGVEEKAVNEVQEENTENEEIKEKEEVDRKVAAKNEVNAKAFAVGDIVEYVEDVPVIETAPLREEPVLKYNYKEDQWSPLNPEGKKQYDRDFLLSIQHEPLSLQKPSNLPQLDIVKDKPNKEKTDVRCPMKGSFGTEFTPNYVKSMSRQGITGKRLSQTKARKVITIEGRSLQKDVKLHTVENAWKPTHLALTDADTEDLYRKMRGILNKLTPQKFDTLVNQVKKLPITNQYKLQGVTELVFEKALDEPNFSVAYAQMCKIIGTMNVPVEGKDGDSVNFRKLLLIQCQKEFEKDRRDVLNREVRLHEISSAQTEEKKKELQLQLESNERRARKRSLGNIRFIGELYKLGMLTANIMHECLKKLVNAGDEESLECLCRLLTTIGKDMEIETKDARDLMNSYFARMEEYVNRRQTSSRVRFMMQDVIELRMNHWKPRREDNNPKTITEIHRDAQDEALQNSYRMQQAIPQKREERRDERRKPQRPSQNDEGWNTVQCGRAPSRFPVDPSKHMLSVLNVENLQLGPGGKGSGHWGQQGSSFPKTSSQEAEKASAPTNRFTLLAAGTETSSYDRRAGPGSRPAPGPGHRDRSIGGKLSTTMAPDKKKALAAAKQFSADAGRPKSEQSSRDNSVNREDQSSKPVTGQPKMFRGLANQTKEVVAKNTKPLLEEFLHNNDYKEAFTCVCEQFHPSTVSMFIEECINQVLERSEQARHTVGILFHELVRQHAIPIEHFIKGLQNILEIADELAIDIPKIWDYIAEIIGPLIEKETLPLSAMKVVAMPLLGKKELMGKFMYQVLHVVVKNMGNIKVGEMWQNSGLQWSDFLAPDQNVNEFIQSNKLEFTLGINVSSGPPPDSPKLSMLDIEKQLLKLLKTKRRDNEMIFDWIESNLGNEKKGPQFIRALMTAVCESAMIGSPEGTWTYDAEAFEMCSNLLQRYLDHNEKLELQSLYALQALMHRLQNPQGVLGNIFDFLYDSDIIPEEAFTSWEKSDDPAEQEGKGVALKSVTPFFTWLQNAEEESDHGDA